MKWCTTLTVALLPATALARFVSKRDDVTTTDTYLFDISLDQFITYRDALDPSTLDWVSDGCTDSPDNPLGFDYVSSPHFAGLGSLYIVCQHGSLILTRLVIIGTGLLPP